VEYRAGQLSWINGTTTRKAALAQTIVLLITSTLYDLSNNLKNTQSSPNCQQQSNKIVGSSPSSFIPHLSPLVFPLLTFLESARIFSVTQP
jgi:hypothetical protein